MKKLFENWNRFLNEKQKITTTPVQEGEMADRKWADNPASDDSSQLTAHQQGRKDALDGKEKSPPEGEHEASDYNHGYDKVSEENQTQENQK